MDERFAHGVYASQALGQGSLGQYNPPAKLDEPTNSRIRDGISQTEQLVSELHTSIAALESRLDTVLTPAAPTPASNAAQNNKLASVSSHVDGRLGILNEAMMQAISRLTILRQRVEV
jgi:hypothetical protein